jgi:hypothetical protein
MTTAMNLVTIHVGVLRILEDLALGDFATTRLWVTFFGRLRRTSNGLATIGDAWGFERAADDVVTDAGKIPSHGRRG